MNDERLPWFPCYPSKLLGAFAAMKPDEGYVYWIVCLRIYEIGGPCLDTLDALVRRTGINKRRVSDALDRLFRSGKLVREAAGIMNPFASKVMTEVESFREGKSRAGAKGARVRWGKDELKQQPNDGKANGTTMANDGHLHLHQQIQKKESKKEDSAPKGRDGWPDDYTEQFWNRYPPFRRTAKKTVSSKLAGIRRRGEITWANLMEGLDRYVASDPGEFAKGPVVWLNGGCWDDEIQKKRGHHGRANGRASNIDPIAAAAARRFGGGDRHGAASGATGSAPPADRVDDERFGAKGSDRALVELDLSAGPDGTFRR